MGFQKIFKNFDRAANVLLVSLFSPIRGVDGSLVVVFFVVVWVTVRAVFVHHFVQVGYA